MADNNEQPQQLDLEQILKTLASLAPPVPQTSHTPTPEPAPQQEHPHPQPHSHPHPQQQSSHHNAPRAIPQQSFHHPHPPPPPKNHSKPPHPPAPQRPQHQDPQAVLHSTSSRITTWRPGLRHLSKLSSSNPSFEPTIQRLIREQSQNIRNWDTGRRHLLSEQAAKRENEEAQLKILSVAGSGVGVGGVERMRTKEQEEEELKRFYEKVWRASKNMAEAHEKELGRLGVPFFCTRVGLVKVDEGVGEEEGEVVDGAPITKKQLVELRRKMLNHLVELYGD